jgi:hypothetical protein
LIKSITQQQFSNEETDIEKLSRRYIIYLEDGKAAKANKKIKNFVCFMMLKHTLALTIRTKNLFFIKTFLNAI